MNVIERIEQSFPELAGKHSNCESCGKRGKWLPQGQFDSICPQCGGNKIQDELVNLLEIQATEWSDSGYTEFARDYMFFAGLLRTLC